jgi:DNA-binding NarL/FixJ family response regulator
VHTGRQHIKEAFAAGAVGFVRKQSAYEDLVPAIGAALAGERFISPSLRNRRLPPTRDGED